MRWQMKRNMISRLIELVTLLKSPSKNTLKGLSQKLEVSERTVKRDVRLLREEYGAPIRFDHVHRHYFLFEDWDFSIPDFTEGELVALLIASVLLKKYQGTPMEKHLRNIEKKVKNIFRDKVSLSCDEVEMMISANVNPVQMKNDVQEIFEKIFYAITHRKTLQITYYTMYSDQTSQREVSPYHLYNYQGIWYFYGYCSYRKEIRDFALDRIKKCKVLQKRFFIPKDFDHQAYLQQAFQIRKGETETVSILFDKESARRICERIWHPSQKIEMQDQGGCKLEITAHPTEIKRWVMGYGSQAEVLYPGWLREEIKDELGRMKKKYNAKK